jgi:DNA-binding NtrC family response regulator
MNVKPQVLIIDDDEVVGRSFDRVLAKQGYDVSTALSGEEALNKIDDNSYDVVFTDIKMPGMDGLEVAERIMDRCPWTPVVVITGYGTEENEAKARVLGTSGFIHKPLTPEIIENITLKALHGERRPEVAETEAEVTAKPAGKSFWRKAGTLIKNIGLFFAAPFIGLAYVIALPFVFFGMIAKLGYRALLNRKTSG